MNEKREQEHRWNLLIELELYPLLEGAKNELERESFLAEYCEKNKIPIHFARNKIQRMRISKAQAEQETEQEEER